MNKLFFILFLFFCGAATSLHQLKQEQYCASKQILGRIETIKLEQGIRINAKLDTGADMSSLSATHIKLIKNKKETWVQFSLIDPKTHKNIIITKPLLGFAQIKKRSDEVDKPFFKNLHSTPRNLRPVINLSVSLGEKTYLIKTNLIDRTHFRFPMILGVDAIKKMKGIVDVTQNHIID